LFFSLSWVPAHWSEILFSSAFTAVLHVICSSYCLRNFPLQSYKTKKLSSLFFLIWTFMIIYVKCISVLLCLLTMLLHFEGCCQGQHPGSEICSGSWWWRYGPHGITFLFLFYLVCTWWVQKTKVLLRFGFWVWFFVLIYVNSNTMRIGWNISMLRRQKGTICTLISFLLHWPSLNILTSMGG
jgi:hypothetical protein